MKGTEKEVTIVEMTLEAAKRRAEKYGTSAKLISRNALYGNTNYSAYHFMVKDFFNPYPTHEQAERLEYLRKELLAERISYAEIAELQTLAPYIDENDVELLEAAGISETKN